MKRVPVNSPRQEKILKQMGEQIKLARLRRKLSTYLIAKRADISRATLCEIEKGNPRVSIGAYANVLLALGGLDNDLLLIAKDDVLGRTVQDLGLKTKLRADSNETRKKI